jgi:hypothetical protein
MPSQNALSWFVSAQFRFWCLNCIRQSNPTLYAERD